MRKKLKIATIVILVWALVIECIAAWMAKPEETIAICAGIAVAGASVSFTYAIIQFLNDILD